MSISRNKKTSFMKGLLAYAVFFLSAAVIGMIILFRFLDEYEKTRPERAVEQYMDAFEIEHIKDAEKDFLFSLDTNIQPPDVSFGIIREFLKPGVQEVKDPANSTDDKLSYVLKCGDIVIGSFELLKSEETAFGLRPWFVSGEDFDFSFLLENCDPITVPKDYKVFCNGYLLDGSYLVEDGIEFNYLKDYYGMDYELPYLCTYKIGEYLSDIDVEVIDETGAPAEAYNDNEQEEYLDRHCDGEKKSGIIAFIPEFIDKYVAFTGSSKYDYRTNYYALEKYMLKGSDIQVRTYNSADSLMFGSYRSNILKDVEVRRVIDLGNRLYMCDITYYVDCLGTKGYITTVNHIILIVIETDSGFLAYEIPEKSTDTIKTDG